MAVKQYLDEQIDIHIFWKDLWSRWSSFFQLVKILGKGKWGAEKELTSYVETLVDDKKNDRGMIGAWVTNTVCIAKYLTPKELKKTLIKC